uniref:CYTH domain-containing protein n=1 Tax=Candidatus Kentrum sp. DK TaxID=2126562 RepID=A0A450SXW9_9GAMM|nr:MAG: CYTH domain-containing protein [Candidatus Kentron sp. DK]
MARTILNNAETDTAYRILDLQRCSLFGELNLEQLQLLARAASSRTIDLKQTRMPLQCLEDRVALVAEGVFESLYLPGEWAWKEPEAAIVLDRLEPGELWGEHVLSITEPERRQHLGLRASGPGRLVLMSKASLQKYLGLWPELRTALLALSLDRALEQGIELGRLRHLQERTDLVLDRIDSVAEILLSGDQAGETHQRKYLLESIPDDLRRHTRKQERLEQAYLPGTRTREDRIRCRRDLVEKDLEKYRRTSRFGAGQSRKEYARSLGKEEYDRLLSLREGHLIEKTRYHLRSQEADVELRLDEFREELSGLILLEAEFPSAERARSFRLPPWLGPLVKEEVTENNAYGNHSLALHGRPAR